jgi:hypothetical protein
MKLIRIACLAGLCIFWGWGACSSAPRKNEHSLRHVLLYNLHFRRPDHAGAKSTAIPGEEDYMSNPLPNSKLDCEPFSNLYKELNLSGIRGCIQEVNKVIASTRVSYRLKREMAPFLEIMPPDDSAATACFSSVLNKLNVPREIFFQSNDEGVLRCYNARIPIVEEEILGIRNFFHTDQVNIDFPQATRLTTDQETLLYLATWSMIPFFDKESNSIRAKIVPDDLCKRCMGEKAYFAGSERLPPLWPLAPGEGL